MSEPELPQLPELTHEESEAFKSAFVDMLQGIVSKLETLRESDDFDLDDIQDCFKIDREEIKASFTQRLDEIK